MLSWGGVYSISQENEFIEVKHRKMPRVNRWTDLPAVGSPKKQVREECQMNKCVDCISGSVKGICLGSVNIIESSNVKEQSGYEVIEVNVDSGAIDSCIPPDVARMFKVRATKMSENGGYYTSASGGVI